MLRAVLTAFTALACFSLIVLAQPVGQPPDKKTDTTKSKDDGKVKPKEMPKSKPPENPIDTGKDTPKPKTPLEKLRLPSDAIIIVVDDLLGAMSLFPKSVGMSAEAYAELKERILALERQLKADKKVPSLCKLTGKLDGDFVYLRADFEFSTEQPKTIVVLGLKGAFPLEAANLDGQTQHLDLDKDDGFTARVEKEGNHQLTFNFRVPVKKSATGALEREIEIGLPGAPTTILNLEMPGSVKELLWNGTLEKTKTPGRWLIGLAEKSKSLSLTWKEPLSTSGNAPPKAEGQIKVDVDATQVNVFAELFLEDGGSQRKEWHLLLPPQAKVTKVDAPGGLKHEWFEPDGKIPYHLLRIPDTTAGRWQVSVEMHLPRPNPGSAPLALGPFQVLGVLDQKGMITVRMPAEVSLGQRLVYTRTGSVYQKTPEPEVGFQYVAPAVSHKDFPALKSLKAPLSLEWRLEKNQLETHVAHDLKLKGTSQGWEIEATTRLRIKALFAGVSAVDLKLPQPRTRGISLIATAAPGLGFPGQLPWAGLAEAFVLPWTYANPDEFTVQDEQLTLLKPAATDSLGAMRVLLERSTSTKEVTLTLKTTYRMPQQNQRVRVELPRALGTQDRSTRVSIQAEKHVELVRGPPGAEVPVPDRHHYDDTWDHAPSFVEIAWRPFHREIVAQSTLDIEPRDRSAKVKQNLRFPKDHLAAGGTDPKTPLVELKVPPNIGPVTFISGGKIIQHDPARHTLWIQPDGSDAEQVNLVLQYDLALRDGPAGEGGLLDVAAVWPTSASQRNLKVRVYPPPGVRARMSGAGGNQVLWSEGNIEPTPDRVQLPSLVLQAIGPHVPLTLEIGASTTAPPAAFRADQAFLLMHTLDDGSQQCRAYYLIRTIHAPHVDIELPLSISRFREAPAFRIGKHVLPYETLDPTEKLVRVKLHPELVSLPAALEISYTIPAELMERAFWRTTLYPPVFRPDVLIGQMRWQLTTTQPLIAGALGRDVRADIQWTLQNWLLTPEAVSGAENEAWLKAKEAPREPAAVAYSFSLIGNQAETVYHLPAHWWLLGCSGVFLVLTLGGLFSSLPRWAFWLLLVVLGLSMLGFALFCPAAIPPLLFGAQPGVLLFLLFAGSHWFMQERQRRQLVFLPGFTRSKPGSTMVRAESAKRPREASTVDSPGSAPEAAAKPSGS